MSTGEWIATGLIALAGFIAWLAGRPLEREWHRVQEANRRADMISMRRVNGHGKKREIERGTKHG